MSQRYSDVLIGLNGSKSILTFFSFPSSVTIVPQYITKPFGGTKMNTIYKRYNISNNKIKLHIYKYLALPISLLIYLVPD